MDKSGLSVGAAIGAGSSISNESTGLFIAPPEPLNAEN